MSTPEQLQDQAFDRLAEAAGIVLHPWQRDVLRAVLATRHDVPMRLDQRTMAAASNRVARAQMRIVLEHYDELAPACRPEPTAAKEAQQ